VLRRGRASTLGKRLDLLQALAANSAGLVEDIDEIVRSQRWLLRQLRLVDEEISRTEVAILEALEQCSSRDRAIIQSLPGMASPLRQAVLLSATGDLTTFRTDRQLRKMLGWYPEAFESGTSVSQHHLGSSGNRIARRELWLWAMEIIAISYPPTPFRAYYHRLRQRGMGGKVAIAHTASKLITVLFHCVRAGQPYDPHRHARDLGLG